MQTQTDDSSLHALRELREIERRRLREAEQTRAKTEKERLEKAVAQARAREERLARESAERQAAEALERAQTMRLGRELESARSEIAHLRGEIERTHLAQAQVEAARPPAANRARSLGWLGITAGATMLVGALALTAAMRPNDRPRSLAEIAARPEPLCPARETPDPLGIEPKPAAPTANVDHAPAKVAPRSHLPASGHPRGKGKTLVSGTCDGTDPLCGIDPSVIDDVGKKRGKRH